MSCRESFYDCKTNFVERESKTVDLISVIVVRDNQRPASNNLRSMCSPDLKLRMRRNANITNTPAIMIFGVCKVMKNKHFITACINVSSVARLREAEVEQEEAEAEVTHEKNQRLKEFKSEEEVKSAELEHIKSEVTEICLISCKSDGIHSAGNLKCC